MFCELWDRFCFLEVCYSEGICSLDEVEDAIALLSNDLDSGYVGRRINNEDFIYLKDEIAEFIEGLKRDIPYEMLCREDVLNKMELMEVTSNGT